MVSMKKTLYSLMLNDEVVREIDRLAHRTGSNRSALITSPSTSTTPHPNAGSTTCSPPSTR